MEDEMPLPKYYGLVKFVAQLGALLGCIAGIVSIFGGMAAFNAGFTAGFTAIFGGIITILVALAGLGVAYCFLAMVKAQIDIRNVVVSTSGRQEPVISEDLPVFDDMT